MRVCDITKDLDFRKHGVVILRWDPGNEHEEYENCIYSGTSMGAHQLYGDMEVVMYSISNSGRLYTITVKDG